MKYENQRAINNVLVPDIHQDSLTRQYSTQPLDCRTVVKRVNDIIYTDPSNIQIPNPYVGLLIYCEADQNYYKVTGVTTTTDPLRNPVKVTNYEKLNSGIETVDTLTANISVSTPIINVDTINSYQNNAISVTDTLNTQAINANGALTVNSDAHITGNAQIDTSLTVNNNATIKGNSTLGNDVNDKVLVSGEIKSPNSSLNYEKVDITGTGWGIKNDGAACLDSLTIRKFLSVPELNFDRVTVHAGTTWLAPGAGKIKEVVPDTNGSGNVLGTGTITLELEDGEYGSFVTDDICLGIYHFENGNSTVTTDDEENGLQIAGFTTIYFKVKNIPHTSSNPNTNNAQFTYQLLDCNDNELSTGVHPVEKMSIVAFGNSSVTTRQHCIYETTNYTKYIKNVNSVQSLWNINKLAMQLGDLSGLTIGTKSMSGYSAYLNNIYMTGVIKQLDPNRGDGEIQVLNYMGNWQQNTIYYKNDEVFYNDALWVAKQTVPANSEPSNLYWTKVSSNGRNGTSYTPKGAGYEFETGTEGNDGDFGYKDSVIYKWTNGQWVALTSEEKTIGDAYFIEMLNIALGVHVIYWNGTSWIDLGNIQGPEGPQGPANEDYSLISSEQTIVRNNEGGFDVHAVTLAINKLVGNTITSLSNWADLSENGLSLYYKRENGSEIKMNSFTFNIVKRTNTSQQDTSTTVYIADNDYYIDIFLKKEQNGNEIIIRNARLRIIPYGDPGVSIVDVNTVYYLSTSTTVMEGDEPPYTPEYPRTEYPEWENGKYLWTKQIVIYSNGTTSESSWECRAGSPGLQGASGRILRMRGEWVASTTYFNNDEFIDIVLYDGDFYKAKVTNESSSWDSTKWEQFNQFQNLATSVLLANQGYVDVLGSGRLFVGQTNNVYGWEMTQGKIRHTQSGLELTADGKLYDPDGISIKVGDVYAGHNENLLFDPYFDANDQGWVKTTSSGLVSQYVSTDYSWPFDGNKLHGDHCLQITPGSTTSSQTLANTDLKRVQLKPNTTYTFSINQWHPSTVYTRCSLTFWDSETGGSVAEKVLTFTLSSSADPKISSYTFSTEGMSALWLAFRFTYQLDDDTTTNKTCYVDAVKLEASDVPTEMNDRIVPGVTDDELLETGIDIANKKITITSDNFVIRNNHGDNTFYVNQNGDITYSGTIFHSMNEIDFNNEQSKSKYLIQEAKTNKPISPSTDSPSTWWCFDALSHDGTYIITNAEVDQEIYLPYCLEIGPSGDRVVHYTRTQTIANGSEQHYITTDELKTLVGKKLTFINDSGNDIYINIGTKCTAADRVSVDNKTIYQFDDNFYSSMCPDVNDSYESGGETYYTGKIKVQNGYILKLEFVVENIKSSINDNTDPMTAGYIWRYNLLPDSITWPIE